MFRWKKHTQKTVVRNDLWVLEWLPKTVVDATRERVKVLIWCLPWYWVTVCTGKIKGPLCDLGVLVYVRNITAHIAQKLAPD